MEDINGTQPPQWFLEHCYEVVSFTSVIDRSITGEEDIPPTRVIALCNESGQPWAQQREEVHEVSPEDWRGWQLWLTAHGAYCGQLLLPNYEFQPSMGKPREAYRGAEDRGHAYWLQPQKPYDRRNLARRDLDGLYKALPPDRW